MLTDLILFLQVLSTLKYLHYMILSLHLHYSLWSTTLGNFYSSQKHSRTAYSLTIWAIHCCFKEVSWRGFYQIPFALMDQLYPFYLACYSIINFSLAKTMKLNTEYPTKDWLKTSENARPLDIIWEKNHWPTSILFLLYWLKYYK